MCENTKQHKIPFWMDKSLHILLCMNDFIFKQLFFGVAYNLTYDYIFI